MTRQIFLNHMEKTLLKLKLVQLAGHEWIIKLILCKGLSDLNIISECAHEVIENVEIRLVHWGEPLAAIG